MLAYMYLNIDECSCNIYFCMRICNTLSKHLSMLAYMYINIDECSLRSSTHQHNFKIHISLNYADI